MDFFLGNTGIKYVHNIIRIKPKDRFFSTFTPSKFVLMKIVLVGSGNVATVLGRVISGAGHTILQVISRTSTHAKILADELNAVAGDYTVAVDPSADMVIVAITDGALQLTLPPISRDVFVVHTAGSVSKEVLAKTSDRYGVMYPLQSLRKEMGHVPEIPLLVDANTIPILRELEAFASTLSSNVARANDEERLKLHTAAVIVSNFTNHLYAMAEDFCKKEHVDFHALVPLIIETAKRTAVVSPSAVQTGPAVRKDIITLDKHLRLLTNHPKLRTTYLRLTDSIMNG